MRPTGRDVDLGDRVVARGQRDGRRRLSVGQRDVGGAPTHVEGELRRATTGGYLGDLDCPLPRVGERTQPGVAVGHGDARRIDRLDRRGGRVVARGALLRPTAGQADLADGVVAGRQRRGRHVGRAGVGQGDVGRAPAHVEGELCRAAAGGHLVDADRPADVARAVQIAAVEPGGEVHLGADRVARAGACVRRAGGIAPPVTRAVGLIGIDRVGVEAVGVADDAIAVDVDVAERRGRATAAGAFDDGHARLPVVDEVLGHGHVDVEAAVTRVRLHAHAAGRVVAGEGVARHHNRLHDCRRVGADGRRRSHVRGFSVGRRRRAVRRRRVNDDAPEAGRTGARGRGRDDVILVRAGGINRVDTDLVLCHRVAIGVDCAAQVKKDAGRCGRERRVGVAGDGVVVDLGRGPTRHLDAVLGDVGDRAVAADGVAFDGGAGAGVVNDDTRLLIGADLVVGDVGRAARAP